MSLEYLLKIKPMIDDKTASDMERRLSTRFEKMGRKMGRAMSKSLRFAMTGGAIGMVLNQVLAPLEEIDRRINETLAKASDIKTRAAQFGSNAAQLMRLESAAEAKGVDKNMLTTMMVRFQAQQNEAKEAKKRGEAHYLANYTDENNTVTAMQQFFDYISNIQDPQKQAEEFAKVFGSKMIGRTAEFVTAKDLRQTAQYTTGSASDSEIETTINRGAQLQSLQAKSKARNSFLNTMEAAKRIDENKIKMQTDYELHKNARENEKITRYDTMKALQETADELMDLLQKNLGALAPTLKLLVELITKIYEFISGPLQIVLDTVNEGIIRLLDFLHIRKMTQQERKKYEKTAEKRGETTQETLRNTATNYTDAGDYNKTDNY